MKKIKLSRLDTCAPEKFNKEQTKKELTKLKFKLQELQNLLFAESKHSFLIVIQGLDAQSVVLVGGILLAM